MDRALVVSSKSFFFNITRYRRFKGIDEKKENSLSCGLSICCVLNCGIVPSITKKRSFMHKDIAIIYLLIFLALLNCHYIFFIDLDLYEYSINQISNDEDVLLSNELAELNLLDLVKAKHCYPLKGKFILRKS